MEQMLKDHAQSFDSTYVFSSEQQQEVKKLYQKYVSQTDISPSPTEKEKLTHLRTLDRSVTRFGLLAATDHSLDWNRGSRRWDRDCAA